jgi:hypothetical protein
MEKNKIIAILSFIIVITIVSGILFNIWLTAKANPITNEEFNAQWQFNGAKSMRKQMWQNELMREKQRFEISEGFKEKVVNILKSDENVQKLLNEGYNITCIRPIVKAIVKEDSTVIMKATGAIVILTKDTSHALVKVDVENNKVLETIILTETIIKSG